MEQNKIQELEAAITKLRSGLDSLSAQFFKNNFTSSQQFNKDVSFNSRMRVPVFASAPTVAEVGDIMSITGVLYICTTASASGAGAVWTVVGTQS